MPRRARSRNGAPRRLQAACHARRPGGALAALSHFVPLGARGPRPLCLSLAHDMTLLWPHGSGGGRTAPHEPARRAGLAARERRGDVSLCAVGLARSGSATRLAPRPREAARRPRTVRIAGRRAFVRLRDQHVSPRPPGGDLRAARRPRRGDRRRRAAARHRVHAGARHARRHRRHGARPAHLRGQSLDARPPPRLPRPPYARASVGRPRRARALARASAFRMDGDVRRALRPGGRVGSGGDTSARCVPADGRARARAAQWWRGHAPAGAAA